MIIHHNSRLIYMRDDFVESSIRMKDVAEKQQLNLLSYDTMTAVRQKLSWVAKRTISVNQSLIQTELSDNIKYLTVKFEPVTFAGVTYDTLILPTRHAVLVKKANYNDITSAENLIVGDMIACVDFDHPTRVTNIADMTEDNDWNFGFVEQNSDGHTDIMKRCLGYYVDGILVLSDV
jgi:hypothetical protein